VAVAANTRRRAINIVDIFNSGFIECFETLSEHRSASKQCLCR